MCVGSSSGGGRLNRTFRCSETDSFISGVENRIEFSDKGIAQNPHPLIVEGLEARKAVNVVAAQKLERENLD
jgi:hypothetical protein